VTARLSHTLTPLFPAEVVCAELIGSGNPESLLPAEARHLGRAVATRREEFAAGRACARLALAELDIFGYALEPAADRQPIWPPGIVGSITHTKGFCAAVVAKQGGVRALGVDTERAGSVKPELWPRICGPEIGWIERLPEEQRPSAATVIFCIKEAFYKCQYSVTSEYLGFNDARVELIGELGASGRFLVHACKPLLLAQTSPLPLSGGYLVHQEFVTAGMALVSA
jgi:4'-phosphopantetheinyl transferase EntD